MKTIKYIVIMLIPALLFFSTSSYADWYKLYGQSRETEFAYDAQQTSDGGFVIVGYRGLAIESCDVLLIKTDANGNKRWERTYGEGGGEMGYAVQQTTDGGYVITGEAWYGGSPSLFLLKTDSRGILRWVRTYDGGVSDHGRSVQQTADGGYIIAGSTYGTGYSNVWLIKTDAEGFKQWDKIFDGNQTDMGESVQQTSDGGYIVCGETFSYGAGLSDVWLIKTDSVGNTQWDKTFGGADEDSGFSVRQTTDGGYIIGGGTLSFGAGQYDAWIIKTDSLGNREWDKTFGGPSNDMDYESRARIRQTSDGGYIYVGSTMSFGAGAYDVWLIKMDSLGNKEWDKTYGGPMDDFGASVQQTSDGGYIVGGSTSAGYGSMLLIKKEQQIAEITLLTPANHAILSFPPTFSWEPDPGTTNKFAVDISYSSQMKQFWSTYDDLHIEITGTSWTPSQELWNQIPYQSSVYWRVRGIGIPESPSTVIYSDMWQFFKP